MAEQEAVGHLSAEVKIPRYVHRATGEREGEPVPSGRRPGYVVLFNDDVDLSSKLLTEMVRTCICRCCQGKHGREVDHDVGETGKPVDAIVYKELRVAAANLTPEQVGELERKKDLIAGVFPNRARRAPRDPGEVWGAGLAGRGVAGMRARALETRTADLVRGTDSFEAYLNGMRDALAMVAETYASSRRAGAAAASVGGDPGHGWALDAIGLGRDYRVATGKAVRVAVLDTGIDAGHPDFKKRVVASRDFTRSGEEGARDGHGHGTHCAGVIGASGAPAGGQRYSVAPEAELLIGKVLDDNRTGYDSEIFDGIHWATSQGARVISMSLSSPRERGESFDPVYEKIARKLLNEKPGVLLVAAAGNDSDRPHAIGAVGNPAACPSIMAVGAVDAERHVAPFSCSGLDKVGEVDVAAPGVAVYSAWPGERYQILSGTSMATPHVAGVAALLLQLGKGLTARELWDALVKQCEALGVPQDFGRGLVHVPSS